MAKPVRTPMIVPAREFWTDQFLRIGIDSGAVVVVGANQSAD